MPEVLGPEGKDYRTEAADMLRDFAEAKRGEVTGRPIDKQIDATREALAQQAEASATKLDPETNGSTTEHSVETPNPSHEW